MELKTHVIICAGLTVAAAVISHFSIKAMCALKVATVKADLDAKAEARKAFQDASEWVDKHH